MDYSMKPNYVPGLQHFSDDELRVLCFAEPGNILAVAEAARRFCHPLVSTDERRQVIRELEQLEDNAQSACINKDDMGPGAILEAVHRLQDLLHVD